MPTVCVDADYFVALEELLFYVTAFDTAVNANEGNNDNEIDAAMSGQWETYDRIQSLIAGHHDNGGHAAAAVLGRLGGMKGGHARAAVLSTERRKEIARMGASARWHKLKATPCI